MKFSMNVNDQVLVKLTEGGKAKHKQYYADIFAQLFEDWESRFYSEPDVDFRGYTKFQMHEIMNIFGPTMFNGSRDMPFENNEIVFIDTV